MAASLAVPTAIETTTQKMHAYAQLQQAKNATRDATLRAGQALGMQTQPGSVQPTVFNTLLESTAGKYNVSQNMARNNQEVIDNVSRKALDLPSDTPLTSQTMKTFRDAEYLKGYEPIKVLGAIPTDRTFKQEIADIKSQFTGVNKSFPRAAPDEVKKLAKIYDVPAIDTKDALPVIQDLRDAAKGNFSRGENRIAKAQIAISKAIEDQIERDLVTANNPQAATLLQQFRASRIRMAVSHAIEDAIEVGTGSVNGRKLASDIQRGKFLTDELADVAAFANTFKTVVKTPGQVGTPGAGTGLMRAVRQGTWAGIGGAAGYQLGGLPGASLGAGIGTILGPPLSTIGSFGTRRLLQSNAMQQSVPDYSRGSFTSQPISDEAFRNALITMPQSQNAMNLGR
jgi:hypothetical protein